MILMIGVWRLESLSTLTRDMLPLASDDLSAFIADFSCLCNKAKLVYVASTYLDINNMCSSIYSQLYLLLHQALCINFGVLPY